MTYYIGTTPISSHLDHSGIPGMRWGRRRFQNEDGSLTEEGKIRYGRYSEMNRDQKRLADKVAKERQNAATSGSNVARSGADIARTWKSKSTKNSPASKMSDDELRKVINRMNLERQYNQLTGADTRRGAEMAEKILMTTGAVIGIVGGTIGIVDTIRKWN